MTILNKFSNLFQGRAKKDLSGAVAQENPNIIYEEKHITSANIDLYRSGQESFVGGRFQRGGNDLIVYKYVIDSDLHLSSDNDIYKAVQMANQVEPIIILHETKHWQNDKFGKPLIIANNYYELTGLFAFNEVSAYTTQYLMTNAPYDAVCEGINAFLYEKDRYIPMYMAQNSRRMMMYCFGADADKVIQHIEKNMTPKYSESFNETVRNYFTFGDKRLFVPGDKVPTATKQKLSELRKVCENATREFLLSMDPRNR